MIENLSTDDLLNGPLGQWLEAQKGEREVAARKSNKRFVISAATLIPLGILLYALGIIGFGIAGFLFVFVGFGAGIWSYYPRSEAIKRVKVGINEAIADAVGVEYSLDGDAQDTYDLCKNHKMLPSHNKKNFEDFWTGEVAGHSFRLFEAHLQYESSDSDGGSSTETKFRGPMLVIGFSRSFHGTTLMQRAGTHRKFFIGQKKDTIKVDGAHLGAVDIVHPDFEDTFDVYSDDQVEARYLVHPTYVERMLEVENAFSGSNLRALFRGGELTVILEAENMFESGGMDASKDRAKLEKTIEQFSALAKLASALNEPAR